MKTTSQKLIEELKSIRYFQRGLQRRLWKLSHRLATENKKEEREVIQKSLCSLSDADDGVDKVFQQEIGKAVVREI